jgi:hypothetical protein
MEGGKIVYTTLAGKPEKETPLALGIDWGNILKWILNL